MRLKEILGQVMLVGLIYIYIYGPPFSVLPVNISTLLFFPMLAWWAIASQKVKPQFENRFNTEIILLLIILCDVSLLAIFSQQMILFSMILILVMFSVPTAYFIVVLTQKYSKVPLTGIFVNAAFIASVISISLLFDLELNNYVKFELLKYDEEMMKFQLFRGFGISDELLFTFSVVQAFAVYFCLVSRYSVLRKSLYIVALIVSIAVNAKIGLLFVFVAVVVAMIQIRVRLVSILEGGLIVVPLIFAMATMPEIEELVSMQLESFANELSWGEVDGGSDLTVEGLSRMLFIPEEVQQLVVGNGMSLFNITNGGQTSDSGWIILLHYGGLVLFLLVLLLMFVATLRLIRCGKIGLAVIFASVILLSNLKGLFFAPKPGMKLAILIYIVSIMASEGRKYQLRRRLVSDEMCGTSHMEG